MAGGFMSSAGRASLQLGRGVDSTTGRPMGVAVIPDEARIDALNAGQKVSYDVAIIESASELSSALGISASAEMRYGLFSASGSLELSEKAQYKTAATYVLARCNVENAPVQLFDPAAKESAVKLKDNPSNFRRAFGDTFVRAAIAGGQFYALLEIIHKDTQKQKSLAASIQAEYNGYIGSAEAKFEMKKETQQLTRESSFRILQYQASGQDVETTLVQDTNAVIERLKAFPGIASKHPVSLRVELASYDTIPDLQPNLQRRDALESALEDCARKKLAYRTVVNDCDFFLQGGQDYFQEPTGIDEVQAWSDAYTDAFNAVAEHANKLDDGTVSGLFKPPALPVPRFKRLPVTVGAPTVVPNLERKPIAEAEARLRELGFNPILSSRTVVIGDTTTPLGVVLSQIPAPLSSAPKGSNVTLAYAVRLMIKATALNQQKIKASLRAVR